MSHAIPIPDQNLVIAVLAAGAGRRFGGNKLDAPCAGQPLGRWVLDSIADAGLAPGIIVTSADIPVFAQCARGKGWGLVTNPHSQCGMGGSIALAATMAKKLHADSLMLLLADMPLISSAYITTVAHYSPASMVIATMQTDGLPGVPARFPSTWFDRLSSLDGDRGANRLLREANDIRLLPTSFDDLLDIDDGETLILAEQRLLRRLSQESDKDPIVTTSDPSI